MWTLKITSTQFDGGKNIFYRASLVFVSFFIRFLEQRTERQSVGHSSSLLSCGYIFAGLGQNKRNIIPLFLQNSSYRKSLYLYCIVVGTCPVNSRFLKNVFWVRKGILWVVCTCCFLSLSLSVQTRSSHKKHD